MRDPERILIVRLSHLGDVVCALGVFHALHEAFPRARIAWAVQPEFAGMLAGLPGLDRVVLFGRRDGWRAWPRIYRQLRDFAPDLAVDVQGNLKSALVTWSSRAPRRAGLARADWREPLGARALTEHAPACPSGKEHVVHRTLALVRHLLPGFSEPLRTDLALTVREKEAGTARLAELLPESEGAIALHLSSGEDVRAWPLERCEELVRGLAGAGRTCLVISGPDEVKEGRALRERLRELPRVGHWVGQEGLRTLASVFTALALRGGRMVGADSGTMHLAWASGLPVTVLEGPQVARRTGPWPLVLAGREKEGPHRELRSSTPPSCAPCLSSRCVHEEGPVCMRSIRAEEVLATLARHEPG